MRRLLPLFVLLALPLSVSAATVVNINTADATLLDTLPGIGPVKADAIIEYRQAHGPFPFVDELDKVKGIGPVTIEGLKGLITVGTSTSKISKPVAPARPDESARSGGKPSAPIVSSNTVQKVESTHVTEPAHENPAVVAPAGSTKVEVAGALASSAGSFWASPWLYGFVGLVIFSGTALLIL